jgi:secondary thiamine-phosphate synthase enzyme
MMRFNLETSARAALIDITKNVRAAISESGVQRGTCLVYCPHTTAAVTINESADPDVAHDILLALERMVPDRGGYRHSEGNSSAHVKSSLVGSSCHMLVEQAQPVLGTWQGVFFCEFDGPRQRQYFVQVTDVG